MPLKFDGERLFRLVDLFPAYEPARFNGRPLLKGIPHWAVFDPVLNIQFMSAEPHLLHLPAGEVLNFKREVRLGAEVLVRLCLDESVWLERIDEEGQGYFQAGGREFQIESFPDREPAFIRAVNRDSDISFLATLGYGQDAFAWSRAWQTQNALQLNIRHYLTPAEEKNPGREQSINYLSHPSGSQAQWEVKMSMAAAVRAGLSRSLEQWDCPACPHLLEPEIRQLLSLALHQGFLESFLKTLKELFPHSLLYRAVFKRGASTNFQNLLYGEVLEADFTTLLTMTPESSKNSEPTHHWKFFFDQAHFAANHLLDPGADPAAGPTVRKELADFLSALLGVVRDQLIRSGLFVFDPGPAPARADSSKLHRIQPKFELLT